MTDTVNKQAQERMTERCQRSDGTMFVTYKGKFNPYSVPMTQAEILLPEEATGSKYKPREILTDILERLAYYEDLQEFNQTPSTPVQGYREALVAIKNEMRLWNDAYSAMNVISVIVDQALSQTDIQPSGVRIEYLGLTATQIERREMARQSSVKNPFDPLKTQMRVLTKEEMEWQEEMIKARSGINSTEDDQPGPSISSTRLMLDGQLCGVCNEGVPLDHAQIGRLEADGTRTPYHMGCEGAANKLEPCTDCGHHRKFCNDCAESSTEEEETDA